MYNRKIFGILMVLITALSVVSPASAQYYGYARPHYNHHYYRGYAPYERYPNYYRDHTVRNVAVGAGIGAVVGGLVGAMASRHGYRY